MKMGAAAAFFAFLVGLIGVVVFLLAFHRSDPLADARKSGDPTRVARAEATIVALRDTGSRHNHNAVIAFELRFSSRDGKVVSTLIERPVPPLQLAQLAVGKRLVIDYDTQRPEKADVTDPISVLGN